MKRRAVFMDRDGTINEDVGYPQSFDRIRIFPFSFDAVRRINKAGLMALIVTNQSGVARGYFSETDLLAIHEKMAAAFQAEKARLDAIFYCPHEASSSPEYGGECACRKPLPGMAIKAQAKFDLDLEGSYVIGDKVEDIRFGLNIGAAPILVLTGYGPKSAGDLTDEGLAPAHVASDLGKAVDWILRREKTRAGGN